MAGFMVLQVWQEKGALFLDEGCDTYLPLSHGEELDRHEDDTGEDLLTWFAQYSAPGYLDQTSTIPGDSAAHAARECFAMFGDDDPGSLDRNELASVLWKIKTQAWEGFNDFLGAYIECLLWSSTRFDDQGNTDENFNDCSIDDIHQHAQQQIRKDCRGFWVAHPALQEHPNQGGHDFCLTRNGHGAGFWDRGDLWPNAGQDLTSACQPYGAQNIYEGDDGRLYVDH